VNSKLSDAVLDLSPPSFAPEQFREVGANLIQISTQGRAMQILTEMAGTRRLMAEQAGGAMSWPFFVVLVFWLVVMFLGFGLFARFNATVFTTFFIGALSVAGAVFLIRR
jgi:hypothetical protein